MTNSGLRTVDYETGWSNRVDVAARRAVMTGLTQVTAKINESNAEKLETDMFEVSWHSGARPSHQVWQGRWYKSSELESVCGLGSVTGLCGANCYHSYYPVIPGISVPTYTEEELDEMNRQENIPIDYNGKQYTKYEALQRQRQLETRMRAERQKIKLLQDGEADETDIMLARAKYRGTSQEYTSFSKAMELPQQRQRVTVDGLGNIGVGKWKIPVEKSSKSGIIKLENGLFKKDGSDPMFDAFGSAESSNPEELEKLLKDLSNMGVEINANSGGALAYQSTQFGKPGVISVTPNASYSAYLHEAQHAKDDMEAGWNGSRAVWDVDEHIRREQNAYAVEIKLAEDLGRPDIADELRTNLENEIAEIKKRDEKYAKLFNDD